MTGAVDRAETKPEPVEPLGWLEPVSTEEDGSEWRLTYRHVDAAHVLD